MTALATAHTTPTERWLAVTAEFMPPLTGPAGIAERLVLMLHHCIDWDTSWVANYRTTYWDKLLPDRIVIAATQAVTLRGWWTAVAAELDADPVTSEERRELACLLAAAEEREILNTLITETTALVLRVRIVSETRKAKKAKNDDHDYDHD